MKRPYPALIATVLACLACIQWQPTFLGVAIVIAAGFGTAAAHAGIDSWRIARKYHPTYRSQRALARCVHRHPAETKAGS